MNNVEPNQIKEYYIAYFDILGYSAILEETPEKESEFLNTIHTIFIKSKEYLEAFNQSPIASLTGNLRIQFRVFSDNIILCVEVGDDSSKEKARIISFMGIVSSLQRSIITECGMTIRGGFTKGRMSINNEYVFGEGLIKVVDMEKKALYPRITVSPEIISYLADIKLFSQEDLEKAISIENRGKNLEEISDEDRAFYGRILQMSNLELLELNLSRNLLYQYDDGVWSLSYLYRLDLNSLIPKQTITQTMEVIKQISPMDYERIPKAFPDMDAIFASHKRFVEQKLIQYSDYTSYATDDNKKFETQEKTLKKYVWVMVYHNFMCTQYNKAEYFINTQANCERRHMKLTIQVLN